MIACIWSVLFENGLHFNLFQFTLQLGEQHERTKESSECLKHLTQQAVEFQKKMNEIYKGSKDVNFPSLQVLETFVHQYFLSL